MGFKTPKPKAPVPVPTAKEPAPPEAEGAPGQPVGLTSLIATSPQGLRRKASQAKTSLIGGA